jgi:hypothetical protein
MAISRALLTFTSEDFTGTGKKKTKKVSTESWSVTFDDTDFTLTSPKGQLFEFKKYEDMEVLQVLFAQYDTQGDFTLSIDDNEVFTCCTYALTGHNSLKHSDNWGNIFKLLFHYQGMQFGWKSPDKVEVVI